MMRATGTALNRALFDISRDKGSEIKDHADESWSVI